MNLDKANLDQIKEQAIAFFKAGKSQEEILKFLRQSGCSQGLSMFLLPSIFNCNMAEAKRLIFFSETWADTRKATEQLHNKIEEVFPDSLTKKNRK
jgi:hypothetical protein